MPPWLGSEVRRITTQESRRAGAAEARVRELEDAMRKLRLQLTQTQEEVQRL